MTSPTVAPSAAAYKQGRRFYESRIRRCRASGSCLAEDVGIDSMGMGIMYI